MSPQIPVSAPSYSPLPAVSMDDRAFETFDEVMDERIDAFEQRFYVPRQHPRANGRQAWQSPAR